MDLSNLRPAEGSRQSDDFRRGRGHGSGNGKTAGKGHNNHFEMLLFYKILKEVHI